MRTSNHKKAAVFVVVVGALLALSLLSVVAIQGAKIAALSEQVQALQKETTSEPETSEPATETSTPTVQTPTYTTPETSTPPAETEPEQDKLPKLYTEEDIELIGRTIWGEAEGVKSKAERAAVAWCILNRVDTYGKTIKEVVTAPKQFQGYRPQGECPQQHLDLAADVLARWEAEKYGAKDVGRTLPADYLYFLGDGRRNHFSIEFLSGIYWDWSLANPYN